jgi:hypothetical protein
MKGQTAIEYLMTYGWAILIILIVAGVLAYYGIFAPSSFLGPTARGFGQIQVLNPWTIRASDGQMVLNLGNRVGEAVTIVGATYEISGVQFNSTGVAGTSPLASGDNGAYTFTMDGAPTGAATGDTYSAVTVITYSLSGGANFTTAGTITGTYS